MRASSLALRALASDGRVSTAAVGDSFTVSCENTEGEVVVDAARFPAAFAAATALSVFPLLNLFFAVARAEAVPRAVTRSILRFKKGLGRFSSSARL